MHYLTIEEVTYGEPVAADLLEDLLALELVEFRREARIAAQVPCEVVLIAERDTEDVRTMLRLATVLEINPAGIETIMHMRRRVVQLQEELRQLRRQQQQLRP